MKDYTFVFSGSTEEKALHFTVHSPLFVYENFNHVTHTHCTVVYLVNPWKKIVPLPEIVQDGNDIFSFM